MSAENSNSSRITPLSFFGGIKPWRAFIAPVAAGTLAAGCAVAPHLPETYRPSQQPTPEQAARAAHYAALNAEINHDPKLRGSILAVDPSGFTTVRGFARDSERRLRALAEANISDPQQSPHIYKALQPIYEMAKAEEQWTIGKGPLTQPLRLALTPLMNSSVGYRAYGSSNVPQRGDYICLAVGDRANQTLAEYLMHGSTVPGINLIAAPMTSAFQSALDYAKVSNSIIKHEIDHCIRGGTQRDGETFQAMRNRLESTADAYEMLHRIAAGETDMPTKMEINVQWRRVNMVYSRTYDDGHDSAATVRLISDDLHANPGMAQQLKGLTLSQLDEKADAYATRAQAADYPHLADPDMTAAEKRSRSQIVDSQFKAASDYASGAMLLPGYIDSHQPYFLASATALRIVQLEAAAHNYLVEPPTSRLRESVALLREKFPDVMQEADRRFAAEQARYPALPYANKPAAALPPQHKSAAKSHQSGYRSLNRRPG